MNKIIAYLKKEWVTVIFLVLVFSVTATHLSNRNDHFQECDSTQVHEALYNFPAASVSFNSYTSQGSFISEDQAKEMLQWSPVKKLLDFYRERYQVTDESEFQARVTRALTRLNPISAFRLVVIAGLSQVPIPFFVQSFIALPTATTYAPGSGLFYGLLGSGASYDQFMSGALVATIILFALSTLVFYRVTKKIGFDRLIAALSATLLLFSLSISSYSYHLGSTIWNVTAGFIWLLFFVSYVREPSFLKKISIVSAILIFFDYLIALYWLAAMAFAFYEYTRKEPRDIKHLWQGALKILKTQYMVIFSLIIIALLFYPPGQTYRGGSFSENGWLYIYGIILNFFGFHNQGGTLNFIQFIIGTLLIGLGVRRLFVLKNGKGLPEYILARFTGFFLLIYLILVGLQILAVFPSRHLLAFAPIAFLLIGLGLKEIIYLTRLPNLLIGAVWIVITILGFFSVWSAIPLAKNQLVIGQLDPDVSKVFIYDCSVSPSYKNWGVPVPVEAIKPSSFAPEKNITYLYISQLSPLEKTLEDIEKSKQAAGKPPKVEIISHTYTSTDACFIGYRPEPNSCSYGFPNQLYKTKFKILSE